MRSPTTENSSRGMPPSSSLHKISFMLFTVGNARFTSYYVHRSLILRFDFHEPYFSECVGSRNATFFYLCIAMGDYAPEAIIAQCWGLGRKRRISDPCRSRSSILGHAANTVVVVTHDLSSRPAAIIPYDLRDSSSR